MSAPESPVLSNHVMERLDFSGQRPYEAIEAAIHLNRYLLAKPSCAGRTVLDVACGQGYGAYLMAEKWGARSVVAVDISRHALDLAARDFGSPHIEYRELDAHRVGTAFPEKHFDLIVSLETFEHLRDPEVFLAGIARILAPGGTVIISCPNDHWYYRSPQEGNPFHIRKYTLEEFTASTEKILGPAAGYLLGAPVCGFMNLDPRTLTGVSGTPKLMLTGGDLSAASVLPTEELITPENCRYYVGYWGKPMTSPITAAIYPASMDASQDAHRALQVESLREEVVSLRTAGYETQQLRARIAELESARAQLERALVEARAASGDQLQQLRAQVEELEARERADRHAGLKIAALQAEAQYLREEFGTIRWELERELRISRAALESTRAELEAASLTLESTRGELEAARVELGTTRVGLEASQSTLADAQSELARLHETLWRIEHMLTFRIRRFGGKILRGMGLRR